MEYWPEAGWVGYTGFSWKGNDGLEYSSNYATVEIRINWTNSAPTVEDFNVTIKEDQTFSFKTVHFWSNFNDADNDNLTKIKVTKLPEHGVL